MLAANKPKPPWSIADYRATGDASGEFERPEYTVRPVSHFAEIRYGIHFKDTNEHGLYGSFTDDDNKSYQSFYRSDASFKDEKLIDDLLLDEKL